MNAFSINLIVLMTTMLIFQFLYFRMKEVQINNYKRIRALYKNPNRRKRKR